MRGARGRVMLELLTEIWGIIAFSWIDTYPNKDPNEMLSLFSVSSKRLCLEGDVATNPITL